jgi:trehalose 6-phosphate phosphatase
VGTGAAAVPDALRPLADDPAHAALFLDFDGTLSAVVEDPREAQPLPGVPALLVELARPYALVAVISGRPTAFLEEALAAPEGVVLAGLYGLERALRGEAHDRWAAEIDAVVSEARAEAPPGIYVEPKGLTVTLHWRHAPDQRQWVLDFAERQHRARDLAVHRGRAERELRPPIPVDKGTVVRALVAELAERPDRGALRAVGVFGDDVGDLPAFAAVGELRDARGEPLSAVRVAAVDRESPREVAAAADVIAAGAVGAVALLRALADAASHRSH